jgi:hypothetical protein
MTKTIFLMTLFVTALVASEPDPLGGIGDSRAHIQAVPIRSIGMSVKIAEDDRSPVAVTSLR